MNLIQTVIDYIAAYQNIPAKKISKDTHFIKDLGMSSLDLIQLVCAAEEHFDVEFDEDRLNELMTVESIANYLEGASYA
jgi:NADH dehydrogenase (ubiquinone) 1 alpha/beta subcomplex 1